MEWPYQTRGLAGQFNSGARAKTKARDEVVHRGVANAEAQFDGRDVARLGECLGDSKIAKGFMIVNQTFGDDD